jgi:hypothetical protein
VAFLALLFLVQARQATRSFEEAAGRSLDHVISVIYPDTARTAPRTPRGPVIQLD